MLGGEVVAMDRHFFHRLGAYDPGMLLWGVEQIELSIRVTLTVKIYIHINIHTNLF